MTSLVFTFHTHSYIHSLTVHCISFETFFSSLLLLLLLACARQLRFIFYRRIVFHRCFVFKHSEKLWKIKLSSFIIIFNLNIYFIWLKENIYFSSTFLFCFILFFFSRASHLSFLMNSTVNLLSSHFYNSSTRCLFFVRSLREIHFSFIIRLLVWNQLWRFHLFFSPLFLRLLIHFLCLLPPLPLLIFISRLQWK